jgi:hypothetical protein
MEGKMACLSRPIIVQMLKNAIAASGIRSPASKVKETHRLVDYGLDSDPRFAVLTSYINDAFKPFGATLSLGQVKACKRVSNIADALVAECPQPPAKKKAVKKKTAKKKPAKKKKAAKPGKPK